MSKWILGLAVLAFTVAPMGHADEIRIGTVDMQKALQSVDAGRKAKSELEREFNSRKKDLQKEEAALRKETDEFKKQSLVMSDEARAKKQGEIQQRIMKYQENTARSQQAIQEKERELTDPILNRLREIIGQLAKKKGYTVVLEKSDSTVLFSLDKDDLTSDVVSAYNKSSD